MTFSVILQSLIAVAGLLTNGSLMASSYVNAGKASVSNDDINYARNALLGTMISQFAVGVILIVAMILMMVYKQNLSDKAHNRLLNTLMTVAGLTLFSGGAVAATISNRLQCYRSDVNIQSAWRASTISAIIGICGSILLLAIQAVLKRDTIKKKAVQKILYQARPTTYEERPEAQQYLPPQ